jgi:hypothetical protein
MTDHAEVNKLKRFTVCLLFHKWKKVAYPRSADGEASGTFLRRQRCGTENHEAGGSGGHGSSDWIAPGFG